MHDSQISERRSKRSNNTIFDHVALNAKFIISAHDIYILYLNAIFVYRALARWPVKVPRPKASNPSGCWPGDCGCSCSVVPPPRRVIFPIMPPILPAFILSISPTVCVRLMSNPPTVDGSTQPYRRDAFVMQQPAAINSRAQSVSNSETRLLRRSILKQHSTLNRQQTRQEFHQTALVSLVCAVPCRPERLD